MASLVQPPEPKSASSEVEARESGSATSGEDAYRCDICRAAMLESHCKLRCLACGYTRDCSDP